MKVALVYDRVNKFGGAERLLLNLHNVFPDAPIYTLVYDSESARWAKGIKVVPTFLNKIKFLRRKHEWLAPIAPLAFETLDFSQFDVVISVTSSDAKSIITRPHQLHICYCLTPTRYFWSGEGEYSLDSKMKILPSFLKKYFKAIDLLTSYRPDVYISISNEVKERVKKYYNRDSEVIYPPIEDKFYSKLPVPSDKRKHYLIVSRLVSYKKVDLVVEAFNKLNLPLVVIGIGSEENRLKKLAKNNIQFLGMVNDKKLTDYYKEAKAVIFPQEEDFGLVPLESQALGTPVIAFARGGALETVKYGKTGLFFGKQSSDALVAKVKQFEKANFNPAICIQNAKSFNTQKFAQEFKSIVEKMWKSHSESL